MHAAASNAAHPAGILLSLLGRGRAGFSAGKACCTDYPLDVVTQHCMAVVLRGLRGRAIGPLAQATPKQHHVGQAPCSLH